MTITRVGGGTAVSGANTNLTPTLGVTTQANDVALVYAVVSDVGTGATLAVSGYTQLMFKLVNGGGGNQQMYLFAKLCAAGEADPTVALSGGTVNDTVAAYAEVIRGGDTNLATILDVNSTSQSNAASQTRVLYPAVTPSTDGCYCGIFAYIRTFCSGMNNASLPSGFAERAEIFEATGSDASINIATGIQTTAAAIASGQVDVTTGTASTANGALVFALHPAASLVTGVAPAVGSIVAAGAAPTLMAIRTVQPGLSSLSLQGLVPISTPGQLAPGLASLALTGLAPQIIQQTGPHAGIGTAILNIQGPEPTLVLSRTISPSLLTSAGDSSSLAPTVLTEWTAKPGVAALALNTDIPNLVKDGSARVTPDAATLVFGGLAVTSVLPFNPFLAPSRTTLDLIGLAPEVIANWIVDLDQDTPLPLALTGLAPTLRGRVAWHNSSSPGGATWHIA